MRTSVNMLAGLLTVFLLACCTNDAKEDASVFLSVGSNVYTIDQDPLHTRYEREALHILEEGKSKLKILLPNTISSQIKLIETSLQEVSGQLVLSYSLEEMNNFMYDVNRSILDSLLIHEFKVNQVYFEVINELSMLNDRYIINDKEELLDFYMVPPFVLAEDILVKIDELIVDEKERADREKKNKLIESTLLLGQILPYVKSVSVVLRSVSTKAILVRTNIDKGGLSAKVFKEQILPLFRNSTQHRSKIRQVSGFLKNVQRNRFSSSELEESVVLYKSQGNHIRGRIGDFSDGVLTHPIASLRKIINENVIIIQNLELNLK